MTRALQPPEWMDGAPCTQADPEAWFPESGADTTRHAMRVCAGCPVRSECLEYALENDLTVGIWGGTSAAERRRIRARRRRAAA